VGCIVADVALPGREFGLALANLLKDGGLAPEQSGVSCVQAWHNRRQAMAQKDGAQQDQAQKKDERGDAGTREEARHLAEEAIEEMKQGNKEEAKFVLDEARDLDKAAVDEVLKEQKRNG